MISLYTGTPGSGKSLHVAKDVFWKLKTRKRVFANFGINESYFNDKELPMIHGCFMEYDMYSVDATFFMNYARAFFERDSKGRIKEGQSLLIIDECQMIFDCRDWAVADRRTWTQFFTQHRKFGYNIVLITQFDRAIDRKIRSLVEYEVVHRKLNNYNLFGSFIAMLGGGSAFMAVSKWYCVGLKVGCDLFFGRKYYNFYDSYKIFGFK